MCPLFIKCYNIITNFIGILKCTFHSRLININIGARLLSQEWKTKLEGALSLWRSVSCSGVSDSVTPWACNPPSSSVRGILQARILEWAAISFSSGSSQPRDRTWVSCISCIAGSLSLSHQGSHHSHLLSLKKEWNFAICRKHEWNWRALYYMK